MNTPRVSILILTKNEQQDLPGCLTSIAWSDDIHLYDSRSTDNTVAIAEAAGAKTTTRDFDNWAAHQNWGLRNIKFKHPWVFYIDADERMTPELRDEIISVTSGGPTDVHAFRMRRRDFMFDSWLKHVQTSPYYIRLFRPEFVRYERLVNPITIVEGPVGDLSSFLDHFPFSKGMSHWIARHNSYSTLEASQILDNRARQETFSVVKALTEKDFNKRRYHQKELFYRLPGRPLIKFFLLYVLKRGFLDGRGGLTYAALQSIYEYFIVLKTSELERASVVEKREPR